MNLNKAMIIGNLTRDPEIRTTATGQTVCNFSVATSLQWNNAQGQRQEKVEYHSIVAWGKLGDICGQYLAKGRKVYVEGRLQTREWEGQDGAKKQRTEIIADNMILLDRPPIASGGVTPSTTEATASTGGVTSPPPPANTNNPLDQGMGGEEIRLEEIPF